MQLKHAERWDINYEIKAVLLLSLGFGFVGLDRFIIYPLFPVLTKELGLKYQDIGLLSSIVAVTWGGAALASGHWADRIGAKKILVPAVVAFSLMVLTTSFVNGLAGLLVVRALMGIAEGVFVPASIVETTKVSKPSRIGFNSGMQQMSAHLFGGGLAPIMVPALLGILPHWHWIFTIVAIPGLILAAVMAKTLRPDTPIAEIQHKILKDPSIMEVLKHRNALVGSIAMVAWLSCLVSFSTLAPNYLTDYLKLSLPQMGGVLSGQGFGAIIGVIILPSLTDRIGSKPVILISAIIGILALIAFIYSDKDTTKLFIIISIIAATNAGVLAVITGPMLNKSLPRHIATTGTGLVVGLGEIIGGAVSPILAGFIVQQWGISLMPLIALFPLIVGALAVFIFAHNTQ